MKRIVQEGELAMQRILEKHPKIVRQLLEMLKD